MFTDMENSTRRGEAYEVPQGFIVGKDFSCSRNAAAATRPFVANSERLAVEYPVEVARSRDQLLEPLASTVGATNARAVYHVAMGAVHDALAARHTPSKREIEALTEFAIKGCAP